MKHLLIYPKTKSAFLTNWYEYENTYIDGMIVIDTRKGTISFDGINFEDIKEDSL